MPLVEILAAYNLNRLKMKKYLLLFCTLTLSSVFAANTPCSGSKGGIASCDGDKFVCKDGSYSASQKICSISTYGTNPSSKSKVNSTSDHNLTKSSKLDKNKIQLVKGFCYSLQASMVCDELGVRVDTEEKINKIVGSNIRDKDSPYSKYCLDGLQQVEKDGGSAGACDKAWQNYGCYGRKIPNLLQENPFKNRNGARCEFNGTY